MSTDAAGVALSAEAALAFGAAALARIGFAADEAQIIAAHLVDSELCGYPALGLARILTVAEHARMRAPRKAVAIVHETPVSAQIDGGNYVGLYAVYRASEIAIEKARANGFALVGVHNSWLSGRNAYYLEKIARAGLCRHPFGLQRAGGGAARRPRAGARHQPDCVRAAGYAGPGRLRYGHLGDQSRRRGARRHGSAACCRRAWHSTLAARRRATRRPRSPAASCRSAACTRTKVTACRS